MFGSGLNQVINDPGFSEIDDYVVDLSGLGQSQAWGSRTQKLSPQGGTIPVGPYKTVVPGMCQQTTIDYLNLNKTIRDFNRRIMILRKLKKQRPQNKEAIKMNMRIARREFGSIKTRLIAMRRRTRNGHYRRQGCTRRDIARLMCRVESQRGVWRKSPTLRKLRYQLVITLRKAKGSAKVKCSKV